MSLLRKAMLCTTLVIAGFSFGPIATASAAGLPYGPDTCKQGFVWRQAAEFDHVCVLPGSRSRAAHENAIASTRLAGGGNYGPNTCRQGFVWRDAFSGDQVCVSPARRSAVAVENQEGPSRRVL
jgi:hypothetical protein